MNDAPRLWQTLVRTGFRLLYNEAAFTYDLVSWVVSLGAWRCWTRVALRFLPPNTTGPVLELAHGPGHLQSDLATAGYRVYGLDLSPSMGRIARRRLLGRGLPAHLVRARAQTLPFADGQLAAVISTFPTDFIVDPRTLAECSRVLTSDGRLVIVPSAVLTGTGLIARGIEFLYRITGQRGGGALSADELQPIFGPYGFEVDVFDEECPHSRVTVIVGRKRAAN
ncbi:MAG: methyltransferase domain-containing protein [Chloroflexi bacterium]|nr:methyltransferase domain-containing protein [Chloroflexota bacterium]